MMVAMTDDLDDLGTPNCPTCLTPLEVEGDDNAVHWRCASCGLVKVV